MKQLSPETITEQLIEWALRPPACELCTLLECRCGLEHTAAALEAKRLRLKYVAALTLRNRGWTLEAIGKLLGHPRGHVTRILRRVRELLRADFSPPAGFAAVTSEE